MMVIQLGAMGGHLVILRYGGGLSTRATVRDLGRIYGGYTCACE